MSTLDNKLVKKILNIRKKEERDIRLEDFTQEEISSLQKSHILGTVYKESKIDEDGIAYFIIQVGKRIETSDPYGICNRNTVTDDGGFMYKSTSNLEEGSLQLFPLDKYYVESRSANKGTSSIRVIVAK